MTKTISEVVLGLSLGIVCMVVLLGGVAKHVNAENTTSTTLTAQMKGDCLRSGGMLSYVDGKWVCN